MRSFAVAAIIGAASAAAVYPVESSTPVYEATTPAYAASTPAYVASTPAYSVASSSAKYDEYPVSSSAGYVASTPVYSQGYPVSSSAGYPVASSSVKYVEYPVTSTKVVKETTFVCPTPTVVTYEEKTYSVTKATTLTVSSYTTTVVKTTQTPEAQKPSSKAQTPVYSASVPSVAPSSAPYPSKNATVSYSAPQGTATGYPTTTKPSTPEFTGAATQAGVGLLAVVGALAAFL
ncbi:hypothetical protein SLS59_001308 [Nothophoma quercina]|uniref:Uncharacterized protein n=1 Tax=Nothophoma quercina TaxID=749835 RepID=A0ABR3RZF0_9PLEO